MIRQKRKIEHIQLAIGLDKQPGENGFDDINLVYNALPDLDDTNIDTSLFLFGKKLAAPVLINAMTGGHPELKPVNASLARVAARLGIAMAVGSQTAALGNPAVYDSFQVARKENPQGVLLANLSARSTWPEVAEAIEMVEADGLQLHLNTAHELAMPEGDRSFKGILQNIEKIIRKTDLPVIVKEVGFGLSREVAHKLYQVGVTYIDVGGKGGTNFVDIENQRAGRTRGCRWTGLGIPTAVSLLECLSLDLPIFLVASGGISTGMQVASALSLGAGLAGIAGHFLQVLVTMSEEALTDSVTRIIEELRQVMLLCGAENLSALSRTPVVISGFTGEWLLRRGVDIDRYARR
jgi:isopentenyl-diphosphate delta-isomerase